MEQDVSDRTGPGLSLAVGIRHGSCELIAVEVVEVITPRTHNIRHHLDTLVDGEVGPYGERGRLVLEAAQPQMFGGDDVCHEF